MYVMEKLQTGQKVEWCTLQELDQLTARKVAEEAAKGDKLAQSYMRRSAYLSGKRIIHGDRYLESGSHCDRWHLYPE